MANRTKKSSDGNGAHPRSNARPKSEALAERGTRTIQDFLDRMDALQADCIARRLTTTEVNAVGNIAGKQLKMLDLAYRYRHLSNRETKKLLGAALLPEVAIR